ncbi:MAG: alpha-N-acetylglucosaminidase N-terminal domain-containing protein, partial [Bacteroidales bacterium]|nr:alpha-N-acetylglucosaminidase N-terminal domain-containing protein [Bacteroidales bacterium]
MMKKVIVCLVFVCSISVPLRAQRAAMELAKRVLGRDAEHFEFVLRPADGDLFTLEQRGDKVRIGGNNDNSMAMGLNYYL